MIYTVHLPRSVFDPVAAADGARFIREGFSWGAFLFGPLWFGYRRSLSGVLIWLAGTLCIMAMARFAGLDPRGAAALLMLFALALGFEAPSILRWSTDRRHFCCVDLVSAMSLEDAETIFLRRWSGRLQALPANSSPPMAPSAHSGLGLFGDEAV